MNDKNIERQGVSCSESPQGGGRTELIPPTGSTSCCSEMFDHSVRLAIKMEAAIKLNKYDDSKTAREYLYEMFTEEERDHSYAIEQLTARRASED